MAPKRWLRIRYGSKVAALDGQEKATTEATATPPKAPASVRSRPFSRKHPHARFGLRTKIIGLLVGMLLVLSGIFIGFTYLEQRDRTEAAMLEKSRVLVSEMDAVWEFVSINQDTINYTSDGVYDYKGLHCAIAGKSVAALFSRGSSYSMRFTNLNPRNAHNDPDDYEADALRTFMDNPHITERYGFSQMDDRSVFRYVSVMQVSSDCVDCHGTPAGEMDVTGYPKEGWETGDIAGAVSVVVPTEQAFQDMHNSIANDALFFLVLMACMAVIIYFVLSRLVTNPLTDLRSSLSAVADGSRSLKGKVASGVFPASSKGLPELYATREVDGLFEQFDSMAQRLLDLYGGLESQVAERTEQLIQANHELEFQRRRVEEINEKLTRDNRYKSDFLAIVSHELRTPLTSILAFADLMGDTVDPADAASRRQLEEIEKNGAVLLEMVDNVLETARIQAGSERVNLELVDLNDVVGMVEASNRPVALKKGVDMTTAVDSDVPLIMSDWEKIRRILTNLVSNAVKFTSAGGHVEVRVSWHAESSCIHIEVEDTGIGIPADKQALVFERFTQENMSTVRRYGGSGLGLSLVKDLSAMLGGTVSVTSLPGVGSTFSVELPAAADDVSDGDSPEGEGAR